MSETYAIEISGVTRSFPKFELGPINLSVPRGAIYGFVGPNGSGKTTTIETIFGMGLPKSGEIRVAGYDAIQEEVDVKKRCAYASPELEFSPWSKVKNALRFVRGFYKDSWDDDLCAQLLEEFELDPSAKISTLSFGGKTKLSLVQALARRCEILVLDEPTTGLDAVATRTLYSHLLKVVGDGEHTVLVSSHDLSDLERFADTVGIIRDGKILHEGPMSEIVDRYCLVDLPDGFSIEGISGLQIVKVGKRVRVLLDRHSSAAEELGRAGVSDWRESPVTLEDLFVSLFSPKKGK